jgi:holo-[acyl-carrier protein] synthase
MIIGTGTDIVKIDRIKNLYEKYGDKFLSKIYTKGELEYCKKRKQFYSGLALRYAAKEAFLKSIKTGLRFNLKFSDIEIFNDDLGAPHLRLHENAKDFAKNLHVKKIHLSLSDDGEYAVANVILEE